MADKRMGTEGKRDILDWLTEVVDEVVKRYCEGVDVVVVRRDCEIRWLRGDSNC